MPRFRNVVIFGDSLSDIGKMASSGLGKVVKAFGALTVNPTGRFSDCRNWTDHMYEAATGDSLVKGDAKSSISASKIHQTFNAGCRWGATGNDKWFRYANYAVGGATGGIPYSRAKRIALTTMKEEVQAFRSDHAKVQCSGEPFLFFVWFGANDLYTAGCPANLMGDVAEKIARKRRSEIAAIVGALNAKFIFVNLGLPLSAARYQLVFDRRQAKNKAHVTKQILKGVDEKKLKLTKKFAETRKEINNFESGALLFNSTLKDLCGLNGDIYVDMASAVSREAVSGMLNALGLITGVQEKGTSDTFVDPIAYDSFQAPMQISTSDEAHPTDRVYKLMWDTLKAKLWENQYTFGKLPG